MKFKSHLFSYFLILFAIGFLSACSSSPPSAFESKSTAAPTAVLFTTTPSLSPSWTATAISTEIPTSTPIPSPTPIPEPVGCKEPPDDYSLVRINGYLFNQRTVSMLEQAAALYIGEIDILGYAITQGSYTNLVNESFGTHAGGGAVDLSVMRKGTYTILEDEIEPLIHALRAAGFAAWLREKDELSPGSPIHIHAIAIGDRDLSPAAKEQLTGEAGYFRGYDGLPVKTGTPGMDRYGGPLICNWMKADGYEDLHPTPTDASVPSH